jgi:hypothetical protein
MLEEGIKTRVIVDSNALWGSFSEYLQRREHNYLQAYSRRAIFSQLFSMLFRDLLVNAHYDDSTGYSLINNCISRGNINLPCQIVLDEYNHRSDNSLPLERLWFTETKLNNFGKLLCPKVKELVLSGEILRQSFSSAPLEVLVNFGGFDEDCLIAIDHFIFEIDARNALALLMAGGDKYVDFDFVKAIVTIDNFIDKIKGWRKYEKFHLWHESIQEAYEKLISTYDAEIAAMDHEAPISVIVAERDNEREAY